MKTVSLSIPEDIKLYILSILIIGFINPILAIVLLAIISIISNRSLQEPFLLIGISFFLFISQREYGVNFYYGSSDDIPNYIQAYEILDNKTLINIIEKIINKPQGNEPIWTFISWIINFFDVRPNNFILLIYSTIISTIIYFCYKINPKNLYFVLSFYILFSPQVLGSIAILLRQQLSFGIAMIGIVYLIQYKVKLGWYGLLIAPLVHSSSVIFLISAIEYVIIKKICFSSDQRKLIFFLVFLNIVLVYIGLEFIISIADIYNYSALNSYLSQNNINYNLLISIFTQLLIILIIIFTNKINDLTVYTLITFSFVIGIIITYPHSNFFERFYILVFPLFGIIIATIIYNFNRKIQISALLFLLAVGYYRINVPSFSGDGIFRFFAYGDALNPFIGLFNLMRLVR